MTVTLVLTRACVDDAALFTQMEQAPDTQDYIYEKPGYRRFDETQHAGRHLRLYEKHLREAVVE